MGVIICIVVFVEICIFITIPIFFASRERKKDITVKQNGVYITLTPEEYELYKNSHKHKEEPKKDSLDISAVNKELDENIRIVLKRCKDKIKIKVLLELLDIKVSDENDLDYKLWLFNAGELRTNDEVMEYNYNIECIKHQLDFDKERHITNILAFFIPFIIVFLLVFFGVRSFREMWFIGIPVSLIPAGFAGIIGSVIGYSINISNAKEYGLPDNDPRVQSEHLKRKVAIASGAISTVATTRHTKRAVKDFANVDSWKEFK